MERRPLKTRGTLWAQNVAKFMATAGVSPNQVSIASVFMALFALISFYYSSENKYLLLFAILFVQLRLLCNLIDGMIAIEYGKKSPTGEIYNDVPDRYADIFIIMGYVLAYRNEAIIIHLGWATCCMAILTAYIRVLGKSLGTPSYFSGPMAKPHRMFFICLFSLIDFIFLSLDIIYPISLYGICSILIGSFLTLHLRLRKIIKFKNLADESVK